MTKAKIIAIYCRVYNMIEIKCMTKDSTRERSKVNGKTSTVGSPVTVQTQGPPREINEAM